MRKAFRFTLFVVAALATCALCVFTPGLAGNAWAEQFSGGTGTQIDPFIVTTAEQLDLVRENLSAYYRLGSDIDLTDYLAPGGAGHLKWGTAGWEPIGSSYRNTFVGGFDGDRHVISGLWINRSTTDYVGLFGYVGAYSSAATVENLGVKISDGVNGNKYVGGLAGYFSYSSVINCYVTGGVSGNRYVGGITGGNGSIINCYAACDVSGGSYAGGLAGSTSYRDHITNSYATGDISGTSYVGGLVGGGSNGNVTNCFATGNVSGSDSVGALTGSKSYFITVSNNYRYQLATVNGAIRTEDTPNDMHGGIVTANQLTRQATYESLTSWMFSSAAWHWDSRGFPKLNIGTEDYPFPFTFSGETVTVRITSQPAASTVVTQGYITGWLSVSASVSSGEAPAYQWYSNTTASNAGGTYIREATNADFPIPTSLAAGTYYYYCVVSASDAVPVTSNVAMVTVSALSDDGDDDGGGSGGGGGSNCADSGGGCSASAGYALASLLVLPLLKRKG